MPTILSTINQFYVYVWCHFVLFIRGTPKGMVKKKFLWKMESKRGKCVRKALSTLKPLRRLRWENIPTTNVFLSNLIGNSTIKKRAPNLIEANLLRASLINKFIHLPWLKAMKIFSWLQNWLKDMYLPCMSKRKKKKLFSRRKKKVLKRFVMESYKNPKNDHFSMNEQTKKIRCKADEMHFEFNMENTTVTFDYYTRKWHMQWKTI